MLVLRSGWGLLDLQLDLLIVQYTLAAAQYSGARFLRRQGHTWFSIPPPAPYAHFSTERLRPYHPFRRRRHRRRQRYG